MDKKKKSGKYKDTARNLVVVVSLVLIIGMVASVTLAQGIPMGFWDSVSEKLSSKLFRSMDIPEVGISFGGASRFPNSYIYAGQGFYSDGIDGLSLGTFTGTTASATLTNGYTEKIASFDLDATSSATLLNPESETIWVYDATVRIQTASTTALSYKVGTSSTAIVSNDGHCGLTSECDTATANDASIMNTEVSAGVGAATTLLDVFFKADYQGIDTRDGSGDRFVVPVLSGEYFSAYASTTPDGNLQGGGQAAQIQIKYYVIED